MMVIAVSVVMILWVNHGFGLTLSVLCCFAHSVYYTVKDILATNPFTGKETEGSKGKLYGKKIELLSSQAEPK